VPEWWPVLLLAVFATHLPFFALRWHRTREARHAATTLTFVLLVATYALRVLAPELRIGDAPAWERVRVVAWVSAAVSIALLAGHAVRAMRRR
jgi:hypothetical protein